jgi:hypothetical protein
LSIVLNIFLPQHFSSRCKLFCHLSFFLFAQTYNFGPFDAQVYFLVHHESLYSIFAKPFAAFREEVVWAKLGT